jgi:hypothetical protein
MVFCKICKYLAIQAYVCFLEHINEAGVGETESANCGVDLQVPEVPEAALLCAAVTEGVHASFQHGWASKTDLALAAPLVALHALQEILAALYMLCPTFDSWHRLKAIRKRSFDDSSQGFGHGNIRALSARGVTAFAGVKVALTSFTLNGLAGARNGDALCKGFVCLHCHRRVQTIVGGVYGMTEFQSIPPLARGRDKLAFPSKNHAHSAFLALERLLNLYGVMRLQFLQE